MIVCVNDHGHLLEKHRTMSHLVDHIPPPPYKAWLLHQYMSFSALLELAQRYHVPLPRLVTRDQVIQCLSQGLPLSVRVYPGEEAVYRLMAMPFDIKLHVLAQNIRNLRLLMLLNRDVYEHVMSHPKTWIHPQVKVRRTRRDNDHVRYETLFRGRPHSVDDRPSVIIKKRQHDGSMGPVHLEWHAFGKRHREGDRPAMIMIYPLPTVPETVKIVAKYRVHGQRRKPPPRHKQWVALQRRAMTGGIKLYSLAPGSCMMPGAMLDKEGNCLGNASADADN